jgi:biotin carboxyl carrier protein
VPGTDQGGAREAPRDHSQRAADHAAIDRLSTELLPALIAKLGATGLGELEVREGPWRVRLRRPADGAARRDRRSGDRGSADRADRAERHDRRERQERPDRHERGEREVAGPAADSGSVATSPAVGIYRPRPDLGIGARVRAGDRLGAVDMLGVPQEVVAPTDGIVGVRLVEPGEAVEYGQELLVIEYDPAATVSTNGKGG